MGTVGLNGDTSYLSSPKGCLLYMTVDGKTPSFNETYCQFPIVGAGVICVFAIFFLGYWAAVLHRYDEFLPIITSHIFIGCSVIMSLFSFVICGEIGIGLSIGCRSVTSGQSLSQCQATVENMPSLYTAQVCAGLMGGFWIVGLVMEYIQYKKRPVYDDTNYPEHSSQQEMYQT
ncbi:hypothetical protein BGZ65_002117 [Modicella reniformis]|uniref:Uncharacterized protein n=1 Tax=Modicella reniformis TaxID=1440133 RepID=A0A9P6MBL8_9FUNG|nr:hypothetical protein BGZ65_002117 [Modicella reniformis]